MDVRIELSKCKSIISKQGKVMGAARIRTPGIAARSGGTRVCMNTYSKVVDGRSAIAYEMMQILAYGLFVAGQIHHHSAVHRNVKRWVNI